MSNLKRDNWTTDEVIHLLEGQKIIMEGEYAPAYRTSEHKKQCEIHNTAIDEAIHMFFDFKRPDSEPGAMAYNVDDKMVYHIGKPLER